MRKNFLSVIVVAFFVVVALASAVNNIHYNAFNYTNKIEDASPQGNYLLKTDGTKVYGDKIKWKSGLLVKDQIEIDGQKFGPNEVSGYYKEGTFYGRNGGDYIQRIVHGKVNVYVKFTEVTTTSTSSSGYMNTHSYTRTDHYAQRGDNGPMIALAGQSDIKQVVSDCPAAVEMADISNSAMRKAIKKDKNYLNSIFDTYNNNCKSR